MSDKLDYTIEFINKKFDLESELPEEYNAGNACYGRDVAEYITNNLKNHDYEVEYLDEDWGWLILGEMDSNNKFEIFIYPWGFLGDESGDEFYLWRLRLRATQKRKILGVFSVFHSIECDEIFRGVIKDMLSKDGNEFRRMDIGVVWQ